jgi:predicted MFS family arabinose efflux permease
VSSNSLRSVYLRLTSVLMLVVLLALGISAYFSHQAFEQALVPEMSKKVASGGATVRSLVLKAIEQGIDFRSMYGVEQSFDELKASIHEVSYVALTDAQGTIAYERFLPPRGAADYFRSPSVLALMAQPGGLPLPVRVGDQFLVSMPIGAGERAVGMLHIGIGANFVDRIVLDMTYDVLIVLIVALFLTLELLSFIVGSKFEAACRSLDDAFERGAAGDFRSRSGDGTNSALAGMHALIESLRARVNCAYDALLRDIETLKRSPAHERPAGLAAAQKGFVALGQRFRFGVDEDAKKDDGQLAKVRAPLFIFILAEEFTRPFLPAYIKDLLVPIPWLSPEIVVGLPIALFMLIVALAQPPLARYCERVGKRRAMLAGAAIAAFGFTASALASTVLDLLLWRSLCALGYALVFVAGQAHVLEHATTGNRARSFSLFVGAIMVATICGPSIGGILADNIGQRLTLGVSAMLALASIATIRMLPDEALGERRRAAARMPTWREIAKLLVNRRFMMVTALAAVPAKILLTGMCFYLVPLYVLAIGSSQSVVGRILMAYAVAMVVLSPIAASIATTRERMEVLVGAGLTLSGLGGALMLFGDTVGWVFGATLLVGIGQSLSISAQSALVREHCNAEVAVMGESAVYGVYRLIERLGNALGPLIAGALLLAFDYRASFVITGIGVIVCGLCFIVATRRHANVALAPA